MSDMSEDVIAHIHSLAYTQLVSEEGREEAERVRERKREVENEGVRSGERGVYMSVCER